MTNQMAVQSSNDIQSVIDSVKNSLESEHSKRAYEKALTDFMKWYLAEGKPGLTKATVQQYKQVLEEKTDNNGKKLSASTINVRISAIRKLAQEASDNGLLDQTLANGISNVKGVKQAGVRKGNWLTKEQAQQLINAPDITTLKGLRNRAILAIMIGSGLRRSEVSELTFEHIQMRENRWVIVDLIGKGNKIRSVPIPAWAKTAIDEWAETAGLKPTGRVFRHVNKGDNVVSDSITPQAIRNVVNEYSSKLSFTVEPHDLRRTFAKLAHKGGSAIDQIQLSLGHESIRTTQIYLGVDQNLTDAPCDKLDLSL